MSIDAHKTTSEASNINEPQLVTGDRLVEELIRQLSQIKPTAEEINKTLPIKGEMESRLSIIMEKLTRETKAHRKVMQKNLEEMSLIREEIKQNQEEIGRIYRLVNAFDRENDIGLGELKIIWGY
jgi:hypothetical protein